MVEVLFSEVKFGLFNIINFVWPYQDYKRRPLSPVLSLLELISLCVKLPLNTFHLPQNLLYFKCIFLLVISSNHRECNTASSNSGDHKTSCTKSSCEPPSGLYNSTSTTSSGSPARSCYAGSCCSAGQSPK